MDTNNAAGLPDFEISLRTGWKDEEKLLLWDEVKKEQKMGAPLKRVFETEARQTGRKPNSVRNYYYMKVKETGEIEQKPSTFVQFSREEIYELLRTLLAAGARGESIRGASLKLAGGDKTLMLRYQNKYRSLIKSARPLVEMVMADMDQEGEKYVSPYETQKTSAVRENRYIPESVARALSGADVDVKAFFKGLAKIAALAAASAQAEQELQMTEAQTENIRKENAALSANVRDLSAKLKKEMERSVKAATLYQQLMKMNASPELKNMESLAGLGELLGAHTSADAL
jgi:predicted transcriptional regulator